MRKSDSVEKEDGLEGDRIPMDFRIVAAAYAYDAMNSSRPYREAMS